MSAAESPLPLGRRTKFSRLDKMARFRFPHDGGVNIKISDWYYLASDRSRRAIVNVEVAVYTEAVQQ